MDNIIEICNPNKKWTLVEVNDILPVLKYISKKHDLVIDEFLKRQRYYLELNNRNEIAKLDAAVKEELIKWGNKVIKLGCKYLSGFILFDCGSGYYSWQSTELKVEYFSYYTEPLIKRKRILEPQ